MKITTRETSGVHILDLNGKMLIGDGDVEAREAVEKALQDQAKNLLINLRGVTAIDSSGVGELVALRNRLEEQGVGLRLLHVEDRVEHVLAIARLIPLFETFNDESEALASFQ